MAMVILGLGSNVGDRMAHLRAAKSALGGLLGELSLSSVYESAALLPEGAPREWDTPFYNMAVMGQTELPPEALLEEVKTIELQLGREFRGVWGPREIDIDILVIGDLTYNVSSVTIPHRGLSERDFALLPLAEIAPDWRFPEGPHKGQRAADICKKKHFDTLNKVGPL